MLGWALKGEIPALALRLQFGTEDATECNTRFLREMLGWSGLLMDGGHENAAINQHREFISPVGAPDWLQRKACETGSSTAQLGDK